jgi:hypothetical protein
MHQFKDKWGRVISYVDVPLDAGQQISVNVTNKKNATVIDRRKKDK